MRILLLFDLAEAPPARQSNEVYADDLKAEDWRSEADVFNALVALGHDVRLFGICDDIQCLLDEVRAWRPDLVFNLVEAFRGDRALEPKIAGLLEALGVPCTGASSKSLELCKDKALSKKLVSHHGVRVPAFRLVARAGAQADLEGIGYPAFVKPVGLEASAGIARDSFVENETECRARIAFVHERLGQDALVEEYIEGRELYVSALGDWRSGRIEVFPTRELFFAAMADGDPKFASFKAKWDDNYRRRWGIRNGFARGLGPELIEKINETARNVFGALEINGYARLDLRLTPAGELVFIEANPNPSIANDDDFAVSAGKGGLCYEKLMGRIVKLAQSSSAQLEPGRKKILHSRLSTV